MFLLFLFQNYNNYYATAVSVLPDRFVQVNLFRKYFKQDIYAFVNVFSHASA